MESSERIVFLEEDGSRVRSSRHTRDGRLLTYELQVLQQPSRARACGAGAKSSADRRPVDPPPIIEMKIYQGQGEAKTDVTFGLEANYFLFANLEHADPAAVERLPPEQNRPPVLTGSPVAGMVYLDRPHTAGFFIFPDLSVRHEGKYKLCFSLFEETKHAFDADRNDSLSSSTSPLGPHNKAGDTYFTHRLDIRSVPFTVFSAKKFPGLAESTHLSRVVAEQGCRVRIRRDVRLRRRTNKSSGKDWDGYDDGAASARGDRLSSASIPPEQLPSSYPVLPLPAGFDPSQRPRSASSHHSVLSRRPSLQDINYPGSWTGGPSTPSKSGPLAQGVFPSPGQQYAMQPFSNHQQMPPPPSSTASQYASSQQQGYQQAPPLPPPPSQQHQTAAHAPTSFYGYNSAPPQTAYGAVPQPPVSTFEQQTLHSATDSRRSSAVQMPPLPPPPPSAQQSYHSQQQTYQPGQHQQASYQPLTPLAPQSHHQQHQQHQTSSYSTPTLHDYPPTPQEPPVFRTEGARTPLDARRLPPLTTTSRMGTASSMSTTINGLGSASASASVGVGGHVDSLSPQNYSGGASGGPGSNFGSASASGLEASLLASHHHNANHSSNNSGSWNKRAFSSAFPDVAAVYDNAPLRNGARPDTPSSSSSSSSAAAHAYSRNDTYSSVINSKKNAYGLELGLGLPPVLASAPTGTGMINDEQQQQSSPAGGGILPSATPALAVKEERDDEGKDDGDDNGALPKFEYKRSNGRAAARIRPGEGFEGQYAYPPQGHYAQHQHQQGHQQGGYSQQHYPHSQQQSYQHASHQHQQHGYGQQQAPQQQHQQQYHYQHSPSQHEGQQAYQHHQTPQMHYAPPPQQSSMGRV